jgi:DNA-binding MarR family transcriptional regulator
VAGVTLGDEPEAQAGRMRVSFSRRVRLTRALATDFGYRAFTPLPDKMLAQRGLGRTHHRVLYFVRRDPGISIGELLAVLEVTKQAIHRPIKDLDERGLLSVAGDLQDRRVRRLSVTPDGTQFEAQLSAGLFPNITVKCEAEARTMRTCNAVIFIGSVAA